MKRRIAIAVVSSFCLVVGWVEASVDIPMTWESIHIQTSDRGGAELRTATDEKGDLERLELIVRGTKLSIPQRCLEGLVRPYLNGLNLSYGQSEMGQSYWSLKIPFEGTGSVELGSTFNLMFSEKELLWSYKSIQIDERTWEDIDVCPLAASTTE